MVFLGFIDYGCQWAFLGVDSSGHWLLLFASSMASDYFWEAVKLWIDYKILVELHRRKAENQADAHLFIAEKAVDQLVSGNLSNILKMKV